MSQTRRSNSESILTPGLTACDLDRGPTTQSETPGSIASTPGSRRWWDRAILFWTAVVIVVLGLSGLSIFEKRGVTGTRAGVITMLLMVLYLVWFLVSPPLLRDRIRIYGRQLGQWGEYLLVGCGWLLSQILALLHADLVGLIYVFMGIAFMAIPVRLAISALILQLPAFAYAEGWFLRPSSINVGQCVSLIAVAGICFTMRRLTEERAARDSLITELRVAQEELQQKALQGAELATLRERSRLARDMHDSIGHALVLISMKLEAASRLTKRDVSRASDEIEATNRLVRETMTELRTSLAGLRTPALSQKSLADALRDLGGQLDASSGIDVTVEIVGDAYTVPVRAQEELYWIAQEGLSNVAKHSFARNASITLIVDGDRASLTVQDDGTGLTVEAEQDGGSGLAGMRERVLSLGGSIEIGEAGAGGTAVRLWIPTA